MATRVPALIQLSDPRVSAQPVTYYRRQLTSGNWQSCQSTSSYYQIPHTWQTHPTNYCHSQPYPCIGKTQYLLMPKTYKNNLPTQLLFWTFLNIHHPHHVFVTSSRHSIRFRQLLRRAHKSVVNIMKEYIERNNMQVALLRFRKISRRYSRLRLGSEEFPDQRYVYSLFAKWQHCQ